MTVDLRCSISKLKYPKGNQSAKGHQDESGSADTLEIFSKEIHYIQKSTVIISNTAISHI